VAKLTIKQRKALERVLYDIRRAKAYIDRPDTVVCGRSDMATTTLHYTRGDGTGGALYALNKEYGSDLCGMESAERALQAFIANHMGAV
jgi:hypothetical protein